MASKPKVEISLTFIKIEARGTGEEIGEVMRSVFAQMAGQVVEQALPQIEAQMPAGEKKPRRRRIASEKGQQP